MPDSHKNFAYSLVATAPSPANSGTSLVVQAGDGTRFPTPPFNATVWAAGAQPTPANAEIVRVTAIATDTLTITRTQESTTARSILVNDQIAATMTAKTFQDIEIPRVRSQGSSGTLYPDFSLYDLDILTAQGAALTIANPVGSPLHGESMVIRIKDNGTARAITYGTQYRAIGVTLPTTTVVNKTLYIAGIWNSTDTKFDVTGVSQEA